jgi:aminopeptidase YwaD
MKPIFRFIALVFLVASVACSTQTKINPDITKDELYAHIDFLSSDSLMGRQPGTPFDRVAAKYIKDNFEASGFTLIAKKGYQFFEFVDHQDFGANNFMTVNKESLKLGDDFTVFSFSSSDTLNAPVVFVGFGFSISTDTLIWDDYIPVNVNGKWAMILRGDPDPDNSNSPFANHSADRHKAMVAKDHGALGVIFVSGNGFDPRDELVSSKQKTFDIGIPVVQVKRTIANKILSASGRAIENIESKLIATKSPDSFIVGSNVCTRTEVITKKRNTQNVVGLIEGSDPEFRSQYIVIGAHYDHIGMGGKGSSSRTPDTLAVHNGADDNASGVAAMLEISQKLLHHKPKRSIIIVAFGAEEMGLLGSRYFTDNPIVPMESIVAMVNLDMLGRMNEERVLQVGGVKTSLETEEILVRVNQNYNFNLALAPQGYGPSDHASFYSKNIPVFFFSTGAHVDYHTSNDIIDFVNFEGLTEATQFIYDVVVELADMANMLTFQEAGPSAPASRHGRELKVRLGIMPDVSGVTNDGLLILAVNENQPAWLAGLSKGDIITAINGKIVNNIQDYMFRLQELAVGSTISLEFNRNGEVKVVLVQL